MVVHQIDMDGISRYPTKNRLVWCAKVSFTQYQSTTPYDRPSNPSPKCHVRPDKDCQRLRHLPEYLSWPHPQHQSPNSRQSLHPASRDNQRLTTHYLEYEPANYTWFDLEKRDKFFFSKMESTALPKNSDIEKKHTSVKIVFTFRFRYNLWCMIFKEEPIYGLSRITLLQLY